MLVSRFTVTKFADNAGTADEVFAAREEESITAEFTPRVRLTQPNFTRAKINPLINSAPHKALRVRVTGMLMFDSAHFLKDPLVRVNVAKGTILRLLESAGTVCAEYQNQVLWNLPCRRIQADEIWSFIYGKDRNITAEVRNHAASLVGSAWLWTAICADTKLMVAWYVGSRDEYRAGEFVRDIAPRLAGRVQLTTDGLRLYINAVDGAFGGEIDYAMLTKLYGANGNDKSPETRYSPGHVIGVEKGIILGDPDMAHISTSYVERQNLTMRMSMRRFTRSFRPLPHAPDLDRAREVCYDAFRPLMHP